MGFAGVFAAVGNAFNLHCHPNDSCVLGLVGTRNHVSCGLVSIVTWAVKLAARYVPSIDDISPISFMFDILNISWSQLRLCDNYGNYDCSAHDIPWLQHVQSLVRPLPQLLKAAVLRFQASADFSNVFGLDGCKTQVQWGWDWEYFGAAWTTTNRLLGKCEHPQTLLLGWVYGNTGPQVPVDF